MSESPTYREHRYTSADGRLNLFARDYAAEREDEPRLPLLMMHGLTRNSADFGPLVAHLGNSRRMIVPDQRGRGLSQYDPKPENYRPDVYAQDMWALLDSLSIDQAVLIGTSLGGLMSILMGAAQPERIGGIVLNDIGPEVEEAGLDRIRSYVGPSRPMADWQEAAARCEAINGSAMDGFGLQDWLAFAQRTCRELSDGRVEFAYDGAISAGMDENDPATIPPDLWPLWDQLSQIPILSLRGAKSDLLSADTVAEMGRQHPKNFTQAEVPGRGHAPILDEPVAVKEIKQFLDRCS